MRFSGNGKWLACIRNQDSQLRPVLYEVASGTRRDLNLPPGLADEVITIPACHEAVLPIVASIPVQLLSYYIAVERGCGRFEWSVKLRLLEVGS